MAAEDFDISRLATYLHMTPQQVKQLADRGKIPARKVSGDWRFSHAEIHHWLENRIGLTGADDELRTIERGLKRTAGPDDSEHVVIAELLLSSAIAVPLAARTRGSVIRSMTDLAMQTGNLWDAEKMAEAIQQREELHPTALDIGVALLHPRRPMSSILGQEFIALGITGNGIPFGGTTMTDVFFMICSLDDRSHLRILARLSRILGVPGMLNSLRESIDAKDVIDLITRVEDELHD